MVTEGALARTGVDAVARKPTEVDLPRAPRLSVDAVGAYTARRGPVRAALPDGAATDATATGRAREVLTQAVRDYALVGDGETVENRVERLRDAVADTVVAYPARGLDALRR
jgi:hypothetical protein